MWPETYILFRLIELYIRDRTPKPLGMEMTKNVTGPIGQIWTLI